MLLLRQESRAQVARTPTIAAASVASAPRTGLSQVQEDWCWSCCSDRLSCLGAEDTGEAGHGAKVSRKMRMSKIRAERPEREKDSMTRLSR